MASHSSSEEGIYRRPLPEGCISFSAGLGKQLFAEALATGHMNCYFKLAAQFCTQDETAFCGLTSLVIVLNALGVDPGVVWKKPWRWYHENTIVTDIPLQAIKKEGLTIIEMASLARQNSLNAKITHVDSSVTFERFKNIIMEYTKLDDAFLILNYNRRYLDMSGGGHISPVGGFHPKKDLLLILDVARFKYPPFWVPLADMLNAMRSVDGVTGKPRGILELSRHTMPPLVLYKPGASLSGRLKSSQRESLKSFIERWHSWLLRHYDNWITNRDPAVFFGCEEFVLALLHLDHDITLLTNQQHDVCPTKEQYYKESFPLSVLNQTERLPIYNDVKTIVSAFTPTEKDTLYNLFPVNNDRCVGNCPIYRQLNLAHFISFLLASWPLAPQPGSHMNKSGVNGNIFSHLYTELMEMELVSLNKYLFNFINEIMHKQACCY